MTTPLADRLLGLKPSATVEMTEHVRAARAAGRKIIGMSSGDPNITTDERIITAAERAMRDGDTRYGPPAGTAALREAAAAHEARRSGAAYDPADIIITPGGKFALLTALMAVINAGDEVLVPTPGWVSYGPCVKLCGGTPVALDMLDSIDPDRIAGVITPRTKAIILNSPVNPTGRILPPEELKLVAALADRHGLWIIFDQVYSDIVHRGEFAYIQDVEGLHERTFVVDSLSKTFGMSGWRLGYLAMPPELARSVLKFVQHSIYCVPGFIQAAGVKAFELYDEIVPRYRAMFRSRIDRATSRLDAIAGMACTPPDATFYLFPSVSGVDTEVANRWLNEIDVAAMPGSAFGQSGAGHLRLSVTCSDADLDEALNRIERLSAMRAA